MEARKIAYLKGEVYYIYEGEVQIATADTTTGVILWEDGDEEPYNGALQEAMVALTEATQQEEA